MIVISANDIKVGNVYCFGKINKTIIPKSADSSAIRGIPNKPLIGYGDTRSIGDDSDTSALVYPGTAYDYSHLPNNPVLSIEAGEPFQIASIEPDYLEVGDYLLVINFDKYSNLRILISRDDLLDINILYE